MLKVGDYVVCIIDSSIRGYITKMFKGELLVEINGVSYNHPLNYYKLAEPPAKCKKKR